MIYEMQQMHSWICDPDANLPEGQMKTSSDYRHALLHAGPRTALRFIVQHERPDIFISNRLTLITMHRAINQPN